MRNSVFSGPSKLRGSRRRNPANCAPQRASLASIEIKTDTKKGECFWQESTIGLRKDLIRRTCERRRRYWVNFHRGKETKLRLEVLAALRESAWRLRVKGR